MNMKPQTGKGPVHRITRGKVEAAIWERDGKKGRFFQVSFTRPFQRQDGTFESSENFGHGQLGDLLLAAAEAAVWMERQREPRHRERTDRIEEHGNGFDRDGREHAPTDEADYY